MAIAKSGHDTEMHKAKDEADENPTCCKYDRTEKEGDNGHDGHQNE